MAARHVVDDEAFAARVARVARDEPPSAPNWRRSTPLHPLQQPPRSSPAAGLGSQPLQQQLTVDALRAASLMRLSASSNHVAPILVASEEAAPHMRKADQQDAEYELLASPPPTKKLKKTDGMLGNLSSVAPSFLPDVSTPFRAARGGHENGVKSFGAAQSEQRMHTHAQQPSTDSANQRTSVAGDEGISQSPAEASTNAAASSKQHGSSSLTNQANSQGASTAEDAPSHSRSTKGKKSVLGETLSPDDQCEQSTSRAPPIRPQQHLASVGNQGPSLEGSIPRRGYTSDTRGDEVL